jgi:hypothetical protein
VLIVTRCNIFSSFYVFELEMNGQLLIRDNFVTWKEDFSTLKYIRSEVALFVVLRPLSICSGAGIAQSV